MYAGFIAKGGAGNVQRFLLFRFKITSCVDTGFMWNYATSGDLHGSRLWVERYAYLVLHFLLRRPYTERAERIAWISRDVF